MKYHVILSWGWAFLLVYIKLAPCATKTINMTGYYFSVERPFSYTLSVNVVD